jgi:hypothetical protein
MPDVPRAGRRNTALFVERIVRRFCDPPEATNVRVELNA